MFNLILLIPIVMVLYWFVKNTSFIKDVKKLMRFLTTKEGIKTFLISLLAVPVVWILITFVLCLPR